MSLFSKTVLLKAFSIKCVQINDAYLRMAMGPKMDTQVFLVVDNAPPGVVRIGRTLSLPVYAPAEAFKNLHGIVDGGRQSLGVVFFNLGPSRYCRAILNYGWFSCDAPWATGQANSQ